MSDVNPHETVLFLKPTKTIIAIILTIFLLAGVAVRLIDVTDLPLPSPVNCTR
jgi:hypothetical protein